MQRSALDTLACVNPACHLCRRPGEAHLAVRKVSGHDRLRLLRCRTCGEECSERRGTALYNTTLPEATAEDVIHHVGAGCRVRATARLVQVATETVARLLRVAGRHAERCHAHETEGAGDMWDHTAVAADSTRVVRLVGGKRTQAQTHALVQDARRRLRAGPVPAIFLEASAGYASAIVEACGRRYSAPRLGMKGQAPHAMLRWPQGLAYGQGHKQDTGNRVEHIEGRARYDTARLKHVLALRGSQQSNTCVSNGRTGPVADGTSARSARRWPSPQCRGTIGGCVGSPWGSTTFVGNMAA